MARFYGYIMTPRIRSKIGLIGQIILHTKWARWYPSSDAFTMLPLHKMTKQVNLDFIYLENRHKTHNTRTIGFDHKKSPLRPPKLCDEILELAHSLPETCFLVVSGIGQKTPSRLYPAVRTQIEEIWVDNMEHYEYDHSHWPRMWFQRPQLLWARREWLPSCEARILSKYPHCREVSYSHLKLGIYNC
jgi:hypothetical protein